LNRIEHVSLSNSTSLHKPAPTSSLEASPQINRRRVYSRQPEMVIPNPASTPLPGVLLL